MVKSSGNATLKHATGLLSWFTNDLNRGQATRGQLSPNFPYLSGDRSSQKELNCLGSLQRVSSTREDQPTRLSQCRRLLMRQSFDETPGHTPSQVVTSSAEDPFIFPQDYLLSLKSLISPLSFFPMNGYMSF